MTATRLGLGAYITAAFLDAAAEQLLGADGVRETVLLILGAGRPAPCDDTIVPVDPAMVQAAGLWDNAGSASPARLRETGARPKVNSLSAAMAANI